MSSDACTIHRAGEYSLVRLAEQHAAGFEGYATPVQMDAAALSDRIRSEHIDLWSSYTLRHEGHDVALVLVARRGHTSRVASMGVPTHARRQGWGRQALQVAIDEARQRGDSLQLEVLTDNHGAVALYESMGFRAGRTLLGFDGVLTPAPSDGTAADADAAGPRRLPITDAAAWIGAHSSGLTWQSAAASLYGLGAGWRAWTNGPSVAITKKRDDTLMLIGLLTHPDHRRDGHARALLRRIAAAEKTPEVRIISIVPEGLADDFFHRCGLATSPLRQFEMTHQELSG